MKEIFTFKIISRLFWAIVAIGSIFVLMFSFKYFFIPDKLTDDAISLHFLIFSLVFYFGMLSFLFYFIYISFKILKLASEHELKNNEFNLQTLRNSNDKARHDNEIKLKKAAADYSNAKDFIKFISELNENNQMVETFKDQDIGDHLKKVIEAYKNIYKEV